MYIKNQLSSSYGFVLSVTALLCQLDCVGFVLSVTAWLCQFSRVSALFYQLQLGFVSSVECGLCFDKLECGVHGSLALLV